MSLSPKSNLVQRTIDLNYDKKQRSTSLKWIIINVALFTIFSYDLWNKCPGYTGWLHYVQGIALTGLAANIILYSIRLLPKQRRPIPITAHQRTLLGLDNVDLDSSFQMKDNSEFEKTISVKADEEEVLPTGLSPPRTWRARPDSPHLPQSLHTSHSPQSPHSSHSPHSPHSQHSPQTPRSFHSSFDRDYDDEVIADQHSLDEFLKRAEAREAVSSATPAPHQHTWRTVPPRVHQLAMMPPADGENGTEEEGSSPSAGASATLCRRLHLDPRRLTEYTLNLRRWLHVTVFARVARELEEAEAALGGARWETAAGGVAARLRALLPFLQAFGAREVATARVRELARGGCLSAYRWERDAEGVLGALCAYLDCVTPPPGFSATHVEVARGPHALGVVRLSAAPPHYALVWGEETLDVGAGRDNLLHTLLLLLGAAARRDPPALARTHLGPAGLNLLWVLGR